VNQVLRFFSRIPSLQKIVVALYASIPAMTNAMALTFMVQRRRRRRRAGRGGESLIIYHNNLEEEGDASKGGDKQNRSKCNG
jgi:hypothetical protein